MYGPHLTVSKYSTCVQLDIPLADQQHVCTNHVHLARAGTKVEIFALKTRDFKGPRMSCWKTGFPGYITYRNS